VTPSCKLCHSEDTAPVARIATQSLQEHDLLVIVRCRACTGHFIAGTLSDSSHDAFIARIKDLQNTDGLSYDSRLDTIEPYRQLNRLLDFGCGFGGFLQAAATKGWNVYGQDVSPQAVAYVRDTLRIPTCFSSDEEIALEFDAITLWGVIEHLDDPGGTVGRLVKRLRGGGVLMIQCPDAANLFFIVSRLTYDLSFRRIQSLMRKVFVPQHRIYFNEKSVTRLVQAQGLAVKGIRRVNINLNAIFDFHRTEAWARNPLIRSLVRVMNRLTRTHFEIVCEKA
jgi:2-polyprenyl-3-methyl-5-hydroxy-6-metoxy-1,4-benzoquinol methylase